MKFEAGDLRFMVWMTRKEWELAYVVSLAEQVAGWMPELSLGESFRQVIAGLAHEYGFEWEGLKVDDDGALWAATDEPLEPRNVMFLNLMRIGKAPDLEVHLGAAVELLMERLDGEYPLEHLRALESKMELDKARVRELPLPKEITEGWEREARARAEALENFGIRRN